MVKTITLHVKQITNDKGITNIEVLTPSQWAGKLRKKGYKKSILTKQELATLTIKIKTK